MAESKQSKKTVILMVIIGILLGVILSEVTVYFLGYHPVYWFISHLNFQAVIMEKTRGEL